MKTLNVLIAQDPQNKLYYATTDKALVLITGNSYCGVLQEICNTFKGYYVHYDKCNIYHNAIVMARMTNDILPYIIRDLLIYKYEGIERNNIREDIRYLKHKYGTENIVKYIDEVSPMDVDNYLYYVIDELSK